MLKLSIFRIARFAGMIMVFVSFLFSPAIVSAVEIIEGVEIPDKVNARIKYGIVRSINLDDRTAIISGFKYAFGAVEKGWTAEVKMYRSDFGALELLRPGMKVKVQYGEFGVIRVLLRLEQLADSEIIEEF